MLAELVLVLPVLLMFFLGIVEFYMMVATKIDLLNASRASVRVAASEGYTFKAQADADASGTARAALGSGRLSKFAKVRITWSQDLPPGQTAGAADWVEAEVEVRARSVIPDVLGWLGFSLGNKNLVAATRMKQE
jgi:Flp pilus assembly protein TadG